jgi:hypothetical protein
VNLTLLAGNAVKILVKHPFVIVGTIAPALYGASRIWQQPLETVTVMMYVEQVSADT